MLLLCRVNYQYVKGSESTIITNLYQPCGTMEHAEEYDEFALRKFAVRASLLHVRFISHLRRGRATFAD